MNYVDPLGLWGIGYVINSSFNLLGFRIALSGELRLNKDFRESLFSGWSGGVDLTTSYTNNWTKDNCDGDAPAANGIEADVGTQWLFNNANSINQLMGKSITLSGASGGLFAGGGGEFSVMTDSNYNPVLQDDKLIWEVSGAITNPLNPGLNFGAEAHANTKNRTRSHPFLLFGE